MSSIIITGASSGIGARAAVQLGAGGKSVVLVGRNLDRLKTTANEIEAAGGAALSIAEDLADPLAPGRIVDQAVKRFGGVAGLVNNAATIRTMPIEDYTLPVIDDHWATNIRAPMLLTQAALPHLVAAKGAVVNISSSSGTLVRPGQSLYGMTKAAVEYLTRSYAGEFASRGVRFNAIAYGPVDTPIHQTWAQDLNAAYDWLRAQVPMGRIGSADEAARWICILLGQDATWVTGAIIPVDGGQVLDIA